MRFSISRMFLAAASLAVSVSTANAAIISGTYSITGSNFTPTTAPFSSVTESFTISFDNTLIASQQTTGISLAAPSTITPGSALAYTYIPSQDILFVGGIASGAETSDPSSADFSVTISNASSLANYGVTLFSYSVGNGSSYTAQIARQAVTTAVPEPTSLALIGSAIAAAGLLRRRKAR